MVGAAIREGLTSPEFHPFILVLASGERIDVVHPDSFTLASIEFRGQRVFASSLTVLETKDNTVVERVISLPLVAQVVNIHRLNGSA